MKKTLLFLFSALVLMSCEKPETTYQVLNNCSRVEISEEPLMDGSLFEVVVFHYIGDDVAGQDDLDPVRWGGGKSDIITVKDNIEKVKLSFKMIPPESDYFDSPLNKRYYLVAYTYIDAEKNNIIEVNDNSMVTNYPKNGDEIHLGKLLKSIK